MGYYEYDTGYYEPSEADIFFDEMKEKFREYLTEETRSTITRLEEENEELKNANNELRDKNRKLESEKSNAKWTKETLRREVENEFYNKAIDEMFQSRIENVDLWFADLVARPTPKCKYCNKDRMRVFSFSDGFTMKQPCNCNSSTTSYEPQLATLQTLKYCVKPSIYNSERKYYMADWEAYTPKSRYDDYGYSEFKILHIVDIFDDDTIDLRNDLKYGEKIGFKSKEECQKCCDWLNNERRG